MGHHDGEKVYFDALFRQKRKAGAWRLVDAPVFSAPLADTHAHLQLLANPALAIARCAARGVEFICTIVDVWEDGTTTFDCLTDWQNQAEALLLDFASANRIGLSDAALTGCIDRFGHSVQSEDAEAIKERQTQLKAESTLPRIAIACGCHPHNAKYYDDKLEHELERRIEDSRVVAIGEIGLDYHYDFSPREEQREAFRRQIRLAKKYSLPIILHLREAHDDGFAILQEEGFPEKGTLLHCFNLDSSEVARWVQEGCYIAFGGPLTFKKAEEVREAARAVPLDKLLTETDSPYMTPEPMRGTNCWPDYVIFTAAVLADEFGFTHDVQGCDNFLKRVFENALTFFSGRA